jgi:pilus assembly protein Flp/PilA
VSGESTVVLSVLVRNRATAIEDGLIAAGIALAIITVVNGMGTNLRNKFTSINNSLR